MNNGLTPVYIPLLFDPLTQRLHPPYLSGTEQLSSLYQNLQQLHLHQMVPALSSASPFVSLAPGIVPMSRIPVSQFVPDGGGAGYLPPSNPIPTAAPAKLRRLSSPAGFVNLTREEMSSYLGVGNDCDWSAVDRAKTTTLEMSQAPDDACHDVSRRTSSTSGFSEMTDNMTTISKQHSSGFEDGKNGFCGNDARKAGEVNVNDMETLEGLRGCADVDFGNETVLMETDDNVNSSFTRLNLNLLNCDVQQGFNCPSQSFGLQRPTLPLSAVFQYQRILPVDCHVYSTPHRF